MITLFDKIFYKKNLQKIAIIEQERKITYKELLCDTLKISEYLKSKFGIKKKICLCIPNSYITVLLFLASAKLKYVIFPINTNISENNFLNYFNKFKYDLCITENKKINRILKKKYNYLSTFSFDQINKILSKDIDINNFVIKHGQITNDKYLIILSSGTTGNPKPIILSQKNKYLRSICAGNTYNFTNNEVTILTYQTDHSIGQRLMFMSLIHNGNLIIAKNFNTNLWYKLCYENHVTFSILVSYHIKNILKKKINLNNLKKLKNLVSVSDVLEDNVRNEILKYNFKFNEIYGAAEISTVTNIKHRINSKNKSVGKILPFVKIKIIDNNNIILSDKQIGEIICKTPLLFDGYYRKRNLTKQSLFNSYFKTGDLGYINKNFLYFTGRKKNIIKVSGINVYPEDIEKKLKLISYIKECYVKGEYDEVTGQKIIAYINAPKKKKDQIYKYCLKNLEMFQIPNEFFFINKIPRTFLGKINRKSI